MQTGLRQGVEEASSFGLSSWVSRNRRGEGNTADNFKVSELGEVG